VDTIQWQQPPLHLIFTAVCLLTDQSASVEKFAGPPNLQSSSFFHSNPLFYRHSNMHNFWVNSESHQSLSSKLAFWLISWCPSHPWYKNVLHKEGRFTANESCCLSISLVLRSQTWVADTEDCIFYHTPTFGQKLPVLGLFLGRVS